MEARQEKDRVGAAPGFFAAQCVNACITPFMSMMDEEQREHEHVVHAQRFLDEIASEELQRLRRAGVVPDSGVEDQRQPDPDERPSERFLQRHDMRLAMEHAEVQREHREDEHIETDPEPD